MRKRLMGSTFLGSKLFLRYPGDDGNIDGTNEGDKSGGGGKKEDQTPPAGTGENEGEGDDDSIDSLFKKQGDDDNIATGDSEDDFADDAIVDDSAIDTEYNTKAETLKGDINNLLKAFVVNEADIPDELGFGDKAKAAEFMTGLQRRAVQQSMQIMNPVISHVMNLAVAKINNRLKTEVKTNGSANSAKAEFDKLGFTDQADRSTALIFYKRGLSGKMTPQKAAAATQKAMALLGKSPKAAKKSGQAPGNRMLEGNDALDSMFT